VIGGGLSGSFCAWVLRSRGISPTVYDLGKRSVGGRLGTTSEAAVDYGAQFFRTSDNAVFNHMLKLLEAQGFIAPWKGKFGILGSQGGFLSQATISSAVNASAKTENKAIDNGDFCSFTHGPNSQFFVGVPSMAAVCQQICSSAQVAIRHGERATDLSFDPSNHSWTVQTDNSQDSGYEAVVLATHDPSLAASVVRSHCTTHNLPEEFKDPEVDKRMQQLSAALQTVRDHKAPVFTISATFPSNTLSNVPFDAVTCPTSPHLQFIARENSKPGRSVVLAGVSGEVLTAVSTSAYAQELLALNDHAISTSRLGQAMMELLKQYKVPEPIHLSAKRWGAGFSPQTLGLKEDAVTLEQWRLAIAGDFLCDHATPIEAAVVSGVQAGERVSSWFMSVDSEPETQSKI